jgi:hypothetical protein
MPHQCTTCGRTFADGSKEMLSGCPDCGGNKFQFKPASPRTRDAGSAESADSTDPEPSADDVPGPESSADAGQSTATDAPATDAADASDDASSPPTTADAGRSTSPPGTEASSPGPPSTAADTSPESPTPTAPPAAATDDEDDAEVERRTDASRPEAEDHAQASARTDMVTPDELADAASDSRPAPETPDGRVIEPQTEERPGLEELREELNSQFESIKIVSPGQYELNLMELYDRQEYIISLQEDGRYVIEVPGSWGDRDGD